MHSSCWKFCYAMLSVYWIGAFGHVCINFSLLKEYYLLPVYFTNNLSRSGSNVVEAAAPMTEYQKNLEMHAIVLVDISLLMYMFNCMCTCLSCLNMNNISSAGVSLFLIVCAFVGRVDVYVLLWVFGWMISGFNQLIEIFIDFLLFKCVNLNLWMK